MKGQIYQPGTESLKCRSSPSASLSLTVLWHRDGDPLGSSRGMQAKDAVLEFESRVSLCRGAVSQRESLRERSQYGREGEG